MEYPGIIFGQILIFALIEKQKKQNFVLNLTNSMTKNRLLAIINKSDSACALVQDNGCILFYNDAFTNLIN